LIVISNHVRSLGLPYPSGALVRINLAWIQNGAGEAQALIDEIRASGHRVFLDYPTGRNKPPKPTLTLKEAITLCNSNADAVALFAFSNAEDINVIELIRDSVHAGVGLCPKIETQVGGSNLKEIIKAAKCWAIMLDAEDLYADCEHDGTLLTKWKDIIRTECSKMNVTCLELKGVIFGA
jgi:pyruvate kinase